MSKYNLKSLKQGLSSDELAAHKKAYWGSKMANFTYSGFEAGRYCNTMVPLIDLFYKNKSKEERREAFLRQIEFWNCETAMHSLACGILSAMEKDCAETGNTDVASIKSVKAALIGPFSAIGDTIWTILWRVIVTGIALNFALSGSILGPLIFIVLYNAPKFYFTWYAQLLGYNLGEKLIHTMGESNLMKHLTNACYVLGAFMVGAMIPMLVNIPMTLSFEMNGLTISVVDDIFNGILPGSLELLVIFIYYKLLTGKKIKPIWLVLGTFVIGILLAFFGVF